MTADQLANGATPMKDLRRPLGVKFYSFCVNGVWSMGAQIRAAASEYEYAAGLGYVTYIRPLPIDARQAIPQAIAEYISAYNPHYDWESTYLNQPGGGMSKSLRDLMAHAWIEYISAQESAAVLEDKQRAAHDDYRKREANRTVAERVEDAADAITDTYGTPGHRITIPAMIATCVSLGYITDGMRAELATELLSRMHTKNNRF